MTALFSSPDPTALRADDQRLRRLLAMASICSALGVPRADWPLFSRWADQLAHPASDAAHRGTLYDVYAYVDVMVADRCSNLRNDLLSDLIMAQVDGVELDSDELRRLVAGALLDLGARA